MIFILKFITKYLIASIFLYFQFLIITRVDCYRIGELSEVKFLKYSCWTYGDVNTSQLYEKIMHMKNQKSYTFDLVHYDIINYKPPVKNAFYHPHLFIDCYNNVYKDILINLQFSKHNYKDEFTIISDTLINDNNTDIKQFIKFKLHAYNVSEIIQNFQKWEEYNDYIIKNYKKLYDHSNSVFKKY